jgi:phosphoglucosamine mutase
MKRLFGTDGIRAVAGTPPLDAPTVRRFGAALAEVLREVRPGARVVLGRDTRESGPWLRDAVVAGVRARGGEAVDAGVISTPGLAWAIGRGSFDAGVMISASHNPFRDNGLKAFGSDGAKLSDAVEKRIESLMLDGDMADPGADGTACATDDTLTRGYIARLRDLASEPDRLRGMKVCLDCGNGAASALAPDLFRAWGAEVHAIGVEPDGRNINLDCGSLHLDGLSLKVRELGYDVGLAFDGDADRCLAVDAHGKVADGDHILFLTGRSLKRRGMLRGDGLVATVMSNFWLEERLAADGIRLHRAPVGDKYVLERMLAEGLGLGGEQSGHVIFLDHSTTGDGMLTGLMLLDTLVEDGLRLHEVLDDIVPFPQLLLNVRVREKPDLRAHPEIGPLVSEIETELAGSGRIVLRYSGTEPLARVMIEARDEELVRTRTERLAGAIRRAIGE